MKKETLQKAADLLRESKLQLEYLSEKFGETGTTNSVLARIDAGISEIDRELDEQESRNPMYAGFRYPPCDLSGAEPGDTVELWIEDVGQVLEPSHYDRSRPIVVKFPDVIYRYPYSGIFDPESPDDNLNVKCLIKKNPTA